MFHCNGLKLAFRMYKQLIQTGTCISFIYIYIKNIAARYGKFYFHATNPGIKARFHRRDQPALNISNCFLLFFFLFLLSLSLTTLHHANIVPRVTSSLSAHSLPLPPRFVLAALSLFLIKEHLWNAGVRVPPRSSCHAGRKLRMRKQLKDRKSANHWNYFTRLFKICRCLCRDRKWNVVPDILDGAPASLLFELYCISSAYIFVIRIFLSRKWDWKWRRT